jgi:hypothetical protein
LRRDMCRHYTHTALGWQLTGQTPAPAPLTKRASLGTWALQQLWWWWLPQHLTPCCSGQLTAADHSHSATITMHALGCTRGLSTCTPHLWLYLQPTPLAAHSPTTRTHMCTHTCTCIGLHMKRPDPGPHTLPTLAFRQLGALQLQGGTPAAWPHKSCNTDAHQPPTTHSNNMRQQAHAHLVWVPSACHSQLSLPCDPGVPVDPSPVTSTPAERVSRPVQGGPCRCPVIPSHTR